MSYVETIEPRLTPPRAAAPTTSAETLVEHCRDLQVELDARLGLITPEVLAWQPHPDANHVAVTVWHVARWLDVLGTRVFIEAPAEADRWHTDGWAEQTGYEPDGLGYLGLGTLTGYTPEQMRAVPVLNADQLRSYLRSAAGTLIDRIEGFGPAITSGPRADRSPYTAISGALQGSFGHVGEIDTLVALHDRLGR